MDFISKILILFCRVHICDLARILAIFPTPSLSHQVVFRSLTQRLVEEGHEVIVVTPDSQFQKGGAPANLSEIDLNDLFYHWEINGDIKRIEIFSSVIMPVLEGDIRYVKLLKLLKEKPRTDLILLEAWVFASLAYNVLWKWDTDELPGRPDNVRISTWFLESVLRLPNVKLFITQSTDEAITAGVSLVGIPLMGDQCYNTEQYQHPGIGIKFDFETFTEEGFRDAIARVVGDDSSNIIRLRSIMQDEPQSAVERAMWSIEYVLRHRDARHLRSALGNIKWRKYFEVDLILILLLGFLGVSVFCSIVLYLALRFVTNKMLKIKE